MAWEMFETERSWLSCQDGMNDWDAGCRRLWQQLGGWTTVYTGRVGVVPAAPDSEKQAPYRARLWRCWSVHWQLAVKESPPVVDGYRVAAERQSGCGPQGTTFEGDPFEDVVLSEAVLQGDRRAWEQFEKRFRPLCRSQSRSFIDQVERTDGDWWSDLMTHLCIKLPAGTAREPFQARGALARFEGRSILAAWLKTVARHFFCERARGRTRGPVLLESEQLDAVPRREPPVEFPLTADDCRLRIGAALALVQGPDRILLRSGKGRKLSNRDAADLLGVSEGHASRLRPEAVARFLPVLRAQFPEPEFANLFESASVSLDSFLDLSAEEGAGLGAVEARP